MTNLYKLFARRKLCHECFLSTSACGSDKSIGEVIQRLAWQESSDRNSLESSVSMSCVNIMMASRLHLHKVDPVLSQKNGTPKINTPKYLDPLSKVDGHPLKIVYDDNCFSIYIVYT